MLTFLVTRAITDDDRVVSFVNGILCCQHRVASVYEAGKISLMCFTPHLFAPQLCIDDVG